MCFSWIKQINRYVKHLLLRKTDFLKKNFIERKIWRKHYLWRAKRHKLYSGKHLFWHYRLQLSFVYKTVSQISFNLLWSEDRRLLSEFSRKWGWSHRHNESFYQSSLGNEADLTDIMKVSPNVLAKN